MAEAAEVVRDEGTCIDNEKTGAKPYGLSDRASAEWIRLLCE